MASYQIPQFLDSGDKILGPLNLRQFGYALGFGFTTFLVFQLSFAFFPSAGWFNIVPALPFALLGLYLALGKYNSRDAEVYVLAAILFNVKPRKLIYVRVPDLFDLEEKLGTVSATNIAKKMKERLDKTAQDKSSKGYNDFSLQNREEKAKKILEIANFQDNISSRTREKIVQMDIQKDVVMQEIKAKEFSRNQANNPQTRAMFNLSQQPFGQSPVLQAPQPSINSTFYDLNSQNFLDEDNEDIYKPGV
jgi:hypothetical protein